MIPLDDWRQSAQFADLCNRKIAFWDSGADDEKPTLLLIHGYPTSSWDWSWMWPSLKARFRLLALDMLGFGLSEKPRKHDFPIVFQADLQEALLERMGIGEAHVLTHDYGNTVGQEILARHNEHGLSFALKSMCFLNGGLFPEQHRARPVQKLGLSPLGPLLGLTMSEARLGKAFNEIFGPNTKPSDEEISGHWTLISEQSGHRILHKLLSYIPQRRENRERWVGALVDARIPMRLIDGGFDPVSGEHLYHYYKEQVPNADAILLDDIGHYPQTEAPAAVLDAFNSFHDSITPAISTAKE